MIDRTYSMGKLDIEDGASFRPSGDMIVIQPKEKKGETEAGIIYNERENQRYGDGVVLSIGPGTPDDSGKIFPVEYKEGDRVLHDKHAGFHEMGALILTRRQHVIAILDDDVEIK
jgi:chaperonin GroES